MTMAPHKPYLKHQEETFKMFKRAYQLNPENVRTQIYIKVLDNTWLSDNVITGLKDAFGKRVDIKYLTDSSGNTTGTTSTTNSEIFYNRGDWFMTSVNGRYLTIPEVLKLDDNPKIQLMTAADKARDESNRPYYTLYDYYDGEIKSIYATPKEIVFDRQLYIKPISKKTFDRGSLVLEEHYAEVNITTGGTEYNTILVKEENNYVYHEQTGNPVRRDTNIYFALSDGTWSEPKPWPKYYTNSTEAESAGIRKRETIITELQDFIKQLVLINPLMSGHTSYFTSFMDLHFDDVQKFIQKNDSALASEILTDKDDPTYGQLWLTEITTPINPTATSIWELAIYYLT